MSRFATTLVASALALLERVPGSENIARADPIATPAPPAPDVDGLGVLAIARHAEAFVDATYAHADGSDALSLAPGARIRAGDLFFFEGALPVGYGVQPAAFALGNVTVAAGLLPHDQRLVALALRIAAPTSPRLGAGMTTAAALATPRIADPERFLPDTTSAELVADWRWRGGASWVQVEAGVAGWWQPSPLGFATVLRATAAGGVHVERWLDLEASFVTRSFVLAQDEPENFVHALLLGIVAHHARGQVAVRLEVPIDDRARDANRFVVGLELRGP